MRTKRFFFIIIITAALSFYPANEAKASDYSLSVQDKTFPYGAGVFSWRELPKEEEVSVLARDGITEIYQFFGKDCTEEEVSAFLKLMHENDIDVYALEGGARWALGSSFDELEDFVSEIEALNSTVGRRERIKGVVLDVEPYGLTEWTYKADDILAQYRRNITRLKRGTDLEICTCIPFAYDTSGHGEQLRKLIKVSDAVLVMNYCRGAEIDSIKNEAAYAKLYGKKLVTIYELQPSEITGYQAITYHDAGLDALLNNYKELLGSYPEQNIGVAYHTIDYLIELSN